MAYHQCGAKKANSITNTVSAIIANKFKRPPIFDVKGQVAARIAFTANKIIQISIKILTSNY